MEPPAELVDDYYDREPFLGRGSLISSWIPGGLERLLEVGCSWGYIVGNLSAPARSKFGLDPNRLDLKHATRKYGNHVTFLAGIAEMIPLESASFDCLILSEVLEHTFDEEAALAEADRVLKPGGLLILTVPHAGWLPFLDGTNWKFRLPHLHRWLYGVKHRGDYTHFVPVTALHRHYSVDRLTQLLEPRFTIQEVRRTGLLIFALCVNFAVFLRRGPALAWCWRLAAADFARPYGPLSCNMSVRARKR
jgi:ubiquinone/menaquinone biosynthesis C-methylase UbiE